MRRHVTVVIVMVASMIVGVVPSAGAANGPLTWWALGDSYSSGEGISGTESPAAGQPECARASGNNTEAKAWAVVARETLGEPRINSWAFTPCTGAISSDVASQLAEAATQSRSDHADIVTLSMGGNDIYFADVIQECIDLEVSWNAVVPGCAVTEDVLKRRIDMLVGKTPPEPGQYRGLTLPRLYDLIATKMRSGGAVIVLGYPQIVEEVARWDGWRRNVLDNCEGVQSWDVAMLRSVAGYLNEQIALAVQSADSRWSKQGIRFYWRDIATGVYEPVDQKDQRHGLCSSDPWLNGISLGLRSSDWRRQRSFHPNQAGHTATGTWLGAWMRTEIGLDKMGRPPAPRIALDAVGPVRIGGDAATAIRDGGLQLTHHDVCDADVDGTTEDDYFTMPSPPGTEIGVLIVSGKVEGYDVRGKWITSFGVSNGEAVNRIADRFRAKGWDVTILGDDRPIGEGDLVASRGDSGFTVSFDESGRSWRLSVPGTYGCE